MDRLAIPLVCLTNYVALSVLTLVESVFQNSANTCTLIRMNSIVRLENQYRMETSVRMEIFAGVETTARNYLSYH